MKRFLILFLCLLTVTGNALASGDGSLFAAIPAERMYCGELPDGMAGEDLSQDGSIHIVIDGKATDWPKAVESMVFPLYTDDNTFLLDLTISTPRGAQYSRLVLGDSWTSDEELYQLLNEAPLEKQPNGLTLWFPIAGLARQSQAVWPLQVGCAAHNQEFPYTIAILWLDANQNVVLAEKTSLRLEHTPPVGYYSFAE